MVKERSTIIFIETGNLSINNYDFYKKLGTFYDLFYDLISEKISFKKTVIEKNEMIKKLEELKDFILSEEKTKGAIKKAKIKTQRKKILATQKSFLSNALRLYDKITVMINAFIDKKIYLGDLEKDVQYEKAEDEESIPEMRRQKEPGQGLTIYSGYIHKNLRIRYRNYCIHCIGQKSKQNNL